MKSCCQATEKDDKCKRITDGKEFDLPRKYSKKRCMDKIAGFTMRSSCAPYKGCKKKTKKKSLKGGLSKQYNLYDKSLKICSTNPVTGYNRSGYCSTDIFDSGSHLVCAKMNKRFLESTKKDGNDLTTPGINFPGLKPGDRWCLCQDRWYQAYKKGKAPKVIKTATNSKIRKEYKKIILNKKTKNKTIKGGSKKQFLFNPDDPKKSFDVYIDKDPSDTIPIKYTTIQDVKRTIRKLERLFKAGKYPHKRIWQVGMILRVRLKVLKKKKPDEYKLAERYFKFLGQRTKLKTFNERKKFAFKI